MGIPFDVFDTCLLAISVMCRLWLSSMVSAGANERSLGTLPVWGFRNCIMMTALRANRLVPKVVSIRLRLLKTWVGVLTMRRLGPMVEIPTMVWFRPFDSTPSFFAVVKGLCVGCRT